jgi:hypothetical protein
MRNHWVLDPGTEAVRLEFGRDGLLRAHTDAGAVAVSVRRCFPWSEPGRFVSLRDDDEKEVALVAQLADLEPASRSALETALAEAGFVLEVVSVRSIAEEVEIRHWVVETRQGTRAFQTRLDDWPRELPAGGMLIRDVGGDLYHIPSPEALDPTSRDLLWAFID